MCVDSSLQVKICRYKKGSKYQQKEIRSNPEVRPWLHSLLPVERTLPVCTPLLNFRTFCLVHRLGFVTPLIIDFSQQRCWLEYVFQRSDTGGSCLSPGYSHKQLPLTGWHSHARNVPPYSVFQLASSASLWPSGGREGRRQKLGVTHESSSGLVPPEPHCLVLTGLASKRYRAPLAARWGW